MKADILSSLKCKALSLSHQPQFDLKMRRNILVKYQFVAFTQLQSEINGENSS